MPNSECCDPHLSDGLHFEMISQRNISAMLICPCSMKFQMLRREKDIESGSGFERMQSVSSGSDLKKSLRPSLNLIRTWMYETHIYKQEQDVTAEPVVQRWLHIIKDDGFLLGDCARRSSSGAAKTCAMRKSQVLSNKMRMVCKMDVKVMGFV